MLHGFETEDQLRFFPLRMEEVELDAVTSDQLRSFEHSVQEFRAQGPLDAASVRKLQEYFRLQHVYHSTGIEGNRLTLQETRVVLVDGVQLEDKPLGDQLEVKDLAAAVDYLENLAEQNSPLREVDLRELHRLAVRNQSDAQPGGYRSIGVLITGSEHRPPEPAAIPGLVAELVAWLNQEKSLDPLLYAAIAHHKLAAIHPFVDGNGRVARLLANLLLLRAGYPIVNIRREDRLRYYEALAFADLGYYSELARLLLERCLETFNEMRRVRDETLRARQWAERWSQKEAEVLRRRQEREYLIWVKRVEGLRLEFEQRADLLGEKLKTVRLDFRSFPPPDLAKYLELRQRGSARQTWFFSIEFRPAGGAPAGPNAHTFFFRFYRSRRHHEPGDRTVPLELNWFTEAGDPSPVEHPGIRLREIAYTEDGQLRVRLFENGADTWTDRLRPSQLAETFFDDVLKTCYGIVVP